MTTDQAWTTWRTSSYSGDNGNCVEVADGRIIGVRDTKDRDGGTLAVPGSAWREFLRAVR